MKERPILFSGPMVRAIMDGEKTQTRRIVKDVPSWVTSFGFSIFTPTTPAGVFHQIEGRGVHPEHGPAAKFIRFKFGRIGDQLWVRETFADTAGAGFDKRFYYSADTRPGSDGDAARKAFGVKWRPSIHMPRHVSRIQLEITGIRVERLRDISEEDARAEGAPRTNGHPVRGSFLGNGPSHREGFAQLFEDINGDGSWESNPWVWVIGFKVLEVKR